MLSFDDLAYTAGIIMRLKKVWKALAVVVIVTALVSTAASALVSMPYRITYEVRPGGLLVYTPPDFTTPSNSWHMGTVDKGLSYEITYKLANTGNTTMILTPELMEPVFGVTPVFTPAVITLLPGESEFVNVRVNIAINAPDGIGDIQINWFGD